MVENQEPALPPLQERPLVTFALFAYNQQNYICEAIEGAFAQTYEPLEIILSDDCSTDRTFEIIEKMAAEYKGPHKIVCNRNLQNMGLSPHVRRVHEMSNGEIVIHAAGDDISISSRTELIVRAFCRKTDDIMMVISNAIKLTPSGKEIGLLCKEADEPITSKPKSPLRNNLPGANGCTAAIHKRLIDSFPAPDSRIVVEDVLLMRRALLLGSIQYIPNALVRYRIGIGISHTKLLAKFDFKKYLKNIEDQILRLKQFSEDVSFLNASINKDTEEALRIDTKKLELTKCLLTKWEVTTLFRLAPLLSSRDWVNLFRAFLSKNFNL